MNRLLKSAVLLASIGALVPIGEAKAGGGTSSAAGVKTAPTAPTVGVKPGGMLNPAAFDFTRFSSIGDLQMLNARLDELSSLSPTQIVASMNGALTDPTIALNPGDLSLPIANALANGLNPQSLSALRSLDQSEPGLGVADKLEQIANQVSVAANQDELLANRLQRMRGSLSRLSEKFAQGHPDEALTTIFGEPSGLADPLKVPSNSIESMGGPSGAGIEAVQGIWSPAPLPRVGSLARLKPSNPTLVAMHVAAPLQVEDLAGLNTPRRVYSGSPAPAYGSGIWPQTQSADFSPNATAFLAMLKALGNTDYRPVHPIALAMPGDALPARNGGSYSVPHGWSMPILLYENPKGDSAEAMLQEMAAEGKILPNRIEGQTNLGSPAKKQSPFQLRSRTEIGQTDPLLVEEMAAPKHKKFTVSGVTARIEAWAKSLADWLSSMTPRRQFSPAPAIP